jgi:pyrrolidone-carboxylate peptidase
VDYAKVNATLKSLWETHANKVDFVLHVGVGNFFFTLETVARNGPFREKDNAKSAPTRGEWSTCKIASQFSSIYIPIFTCNECILDSPRELKVETDLNAMLSHIKVNGVDARLSADAGLFLCEWTLYSSIMYARKVPNTRKKPKVVFLHVPPVEDYSQEVINEVVWSAVKFLSK